MAHAAAPDQSAALPEVLARPYAPSWVDQLTELIARVPGPSIFVYALIALLLLLVQIYIQWQSGIGLTIKPFWVVFVASAPFDLFVIRYLDKIAAESLQRFSPALSCSEEQAKDLGYRLTTMPAVTALLVSGVGLFIGCIVLATTPFSMQVAIVEVAETQLSVVFNQIIGLVTSVLAAMVFYHTWHQLRLVSLILNRHTRVDLFNQRPLYAFSDLSARTAIILLVITYSWQAAAPEILSDFGTAIYAIIFAGASVLAFVLPLVGIHRALVSEKERHLGEIVDRMKKLSQELHQRVDGQKVTDMANLNNAMLSLEISRHAAQRVPTWPWQPETLRTVLAALFFPLLVWLTQWLLQRLIPPQ